MKKILFCTESSNINSGYGKYTKNILSRLYDTKKYDIAELSCGRTAQQPKTEPWKIYPNAVNNGDIRHQSYVSNKGNQFGQWRFDVALMDFKPDIVIDFRDIFMMTHEIVSPLRSNYHLVIAPTIDTFPIKAEWVSNIHQADTVLTHTNWAKNKLEQEYGITVGGVVKDSVDMNIFKPMNNMAIKMKYNIPTDSKIIGSVMRNQRRKIIPELLKVFSGVLKNKPDTMLHLHTSYPETSGWDIPSLLLEHNLQNKVLFTYMCHRCKKISINTWKTEANHCSACHHRSSTVVNVNSNLSDKDLNEIYSLFDVYVQYSLCEGFGIPPLEAAACGINTILPNQGALAELGKTINSKLIDCEYSFRSLGHNGDRFYPNNNQCIDAICEILSMNEIEKIKSKDEIRMAATGQHNWDKTCQEYENIIDNINTTNKTWKTIKPSHFKKIDKNVPGGLNNRDFVYYMIDNIIEEPWLKSTYFVQNLIKSLNVGYTLDGGKTQKCTQEDARALFQLLLNNKITLHKHNYSDRLNLDFDFLNYK